MRRLSDLALHVRRTSETTADALVLLEPDFAGFLGHFPGRPVLPAMCQIELAVRAASLALGAPHDLVEVEHARFLRTVGPGEELRMALTLRSADGTRRDVAVLAVHSVDDARVAELRLRVSSRTSSGSR